MKFWKNWWDENNYIVIFITIIVLFIGGIIFGILYAESPYYSDKEEFESVVTCDKTKNGQTYILIEIGGDTWYTYDKQYFYDLKSGNKSSERSRLSLKSVFEKLETKNIQDHIKSRKKEKILKQEQLQLDLEKENEKLKEENKNLKKNMTNK